MKVTLVSGFLGSGKTSLLKHVLTNKDSGMKCAVIVNEISEFNIDALAVGNAQLLKQEEKMVEMSNGCICCTLREDLLEQLTELEEAGFDAALIESSGIAEPMQVAETFFFPYEKDKETGKIKYMKDEAHDHSHGPGGHQHHHHEGGACPLNKNQEILQKKCPLDNCVTIVDASTLTQHMQSIGSTHLLNKERTAEDDHNIATLMFDQLEFANVIILNKIDALQDSRNVASASNETVESLTTLIKRVNPNVLKVIPTTHSKVDLKDVINTGNFSEDFASKAHGWMNDVVTGLKHVPETEEYGVSAFSFTPKIPFHPERLYNWIKQYFVLEQQVLETVQVKIDEDGNEEEVDEKKETPEEKAKWVEEANKRSAARTAKYGNIFRSKGYVWLGQPRRYDIFAGWGQAGNTLNFGAQGVWAEFPQNDSPIPIEVEPGQRLVFIGQDLKKDVLMSDLKTLLCTKEERKKLDKALKKRYKLPNPFADDIDDDVFPDPFAAFAMAPPEDEEDEEEEDEEEEDEDDEQEVGEKKDRADGPEDSTEEPPSKRARQA